ncbi:hypothetical protein CMU86_11635 [Elizabethkingia anophelis]|nr:hypothetical protein [Elizabethkingia anophelis]
MENNKYTVEDTEKGCVITFEKGCIVDYEELWDRILVGNLVKNQHVSSESGKYVDFVKFHKKVEVEIKAITRKTLDNGK